MNRVKIKHWSYDGCYSNGKWHFIMIMAQDDKQNNYKFLYKCNRLKIFLECNYKVQLLTTFDDKSLSPFYISPQKFFLKTHEIFDWPDNFISELQDYYDKNVELDKKLHQIYKKM